VMFGKYSVVPFIRLYKAKEENEALYDLQTYIHSELTYYNY